MKVELIEKFNTSFGLILRIKVAQPLNLGDVIQIGKKEYRINDFCIPSGAFDCKIINVRATEL